MDRLELARRLFGDGVEGTSTFHPAETQTYIGKAVTDSADGLVRVDIGNSTTEDGEEGIEVATTVSVKEGEEVYVTAVGGTVAKSYYVSGVVGLGDETNSRITAIETDYVKATMLEADLAEIGVLTADSAVITEIQAETAKVENVTAAQLEASTAYIGALQTGNVTAQNIIADKAKLAQIDTAQITADHAVIDTLDSNYAKIDLANVSNAWIDDGVIRDAAIGDAQIADISANKLTAGTINGSVINVTNLNAANITTGTINGQRLGEGSIALSKLSESVYTEGEVDSIVSNLNDRIDSAIETYTATAVPTLSNYPASSWDTDDEKAEHVGDICYVLNAGSETDGYTYRFAYDNSTGTYQWVLIKDNQVTAALQRLVDAEGDIDGLQSFQSDTSVWISDTDEALNVIRSNHTSLTTVVNKTIVETVQLWYSKANTTAPAKPTSQVTSTSTSGGAWRTVVPSYSTSYPNYFYCYQWKYADGTYGWSSVTRDIAMGEAQSTSRTAASNASTAITNAATAQTTAEGAATAASNAQSTANKNVKTSIQLWYTKDNETAPAKPSARVTSDSTAGGGWRTVVPSYNASYPKYFYCYQHELADGTYTWSDVVFDRATTENEANAHSALTQLNTKVDTSTFNDLTDTVSEHTRKITNLTTITASNGLTTDTNITNTVNSVSQTATSNSSKLTQLMTTLGTNADGTSKAGDIVHRTSAVEQDLGGFKSTVSQTYATKNELSAETTARSTAIQQTTEAIALKANSSDVYTKSATDGLISTEVTNRNAAIQTATDGIRSEVSETYVTKTEVRRTDTGTGIVITSDDAANLPPLSITIHGKSVQDGTPSPSSPVAIDSVEAPNILPPTVYNTAVANTTIAGNANYRSMYCAVEPSTQYTVMRETVEGNRFRIYWASTEPVSGVTVRELFASNDTTTSVVVETPAQARWLYIYLANNGSTITPTNVRVAEGAVCHVPKDGNIDANVSGKNQFSVNGTHYDHGAYIYDYVPMLKPNTEYTCSTNIPQTSTAAVYFGGASTATNGVWTGRPVTATTDANGGVFIGVRFNAPSDSVNAYQGLQDGTYWLQLEEGTAATEYEPHTEVSVNIDLQGNALCSTPDNAESVIEIDGEGNATLVKRVTSQTFDGSESWHSYNYGGVLGYYRNVDYAPLYHYNNALGKAYCSAFEYINAAVANTWYFSSNREVNFKYPTATTVDEWKAYLAEHPLTIVYELAEPQTISLGKIDLPSLPSPSFSMHVDASVTPTLDAEWWTQGGEEVGSVYQRTSALEQDAEGLSVRMRGLETDAVRKSKDEWTAWLDVGTDSDNNPFLAMGQSGNDLNSRLSNESMGFYNGTEELMKLSGAEGVKADTVRTKRVYIGSWILEELDSGDMAIKLVGGGA